MELFTLHCPTCGAQLQITGAAHRFACEHCGNHYLLEHKIEELNPAEREHLQPTATFTNQVKQWIQVAEYKLHLHAISLELVGEERVLYADIEFRNESEQPFTCRHDQWIVFDNDGYTYEPAMDFAAPQVYEQRGRRYLGMTRMLTPGMRLRGWLGFILPATGMVKCLQFSGGIPLKTVEFQVERA
jgi:DNA-directed RNA polymerase subunit RPC12/RpoP